MKLDRLKALAVIPLDDVDIEDAYEALVALPGLLRVCNAYVRSRAEENLSMAGRLGFHITNETIANEQAKAEKKLEELLG